MKSLTSRPERVGHELKRFIAEILQTEIKDPRLSLVTITDCVVSKDLKHAKVYFTLFGDATRVDSVLAGLNSARGFIKRRVGSNLELRSIPEIVFYYDTSLEYGLKIDELIHKVQNEK